MAVKVTTVPSTYVAVHGVWSAGQTTPGGTALTDPPPLTCTPKVRVNVLRKVAVTDRPAVMFTRQLPLPVQSPLQPLKTEPVAGVAVRVTPAPEL